MSVVAERPYGLPREAIGRIRDVLDGHPAILGCVLYGSRALGNYRKGSDIDLCLDAPAMSLAELLKIENEIDDLLLPWKVDLTVRQRIDNTALLDHIDRVGVPFSVPSDGCH
ncbi:MAG: nucleotidyltransferase domain-containing protein [Nitrospira sp.]|nr:nucleotidyltransferase domain-containing protein [Nitrospira sp.]